MAGIRIGNVTHFYGKISVAVIQLTGKIQVGDTVHFLGSSTDFNQNVTSLQIEHQSIEEANPGQEVAMKVNRRVRNGDKVFKLEVED
jgi:translation elongation factor EF-1alpha